MGSKNENWKRNFGELKEQFLSIFVDSIPKKMGRRGLKSMFQWHGVVRDVYILKRRRVRTNSKYGFVCFSSLVEALAATRILNGIRVKNRVIKVCLATCSKRSRESSVKRIWVKKDRKSLEIAISEPGVVASPIISASFNPMNFSVVCSANVLDLGEKSTIKKDVINKIKLVLFRVENVMEYGNTLGMTTILNVVKFMDLIVELILKELDNVRSNCIESGLPLDAGKGLESVDQVGAINPTLHGGGSPPKVDRGENLSIHKVVRHDLEEG